MGLKVLITGGLGFLGQQLAKLILKSGRISNANDMSCHVDSIILADVFAPKPEALDEELRDPRVEIRVVDISDREACMQLVEVDMTVFHFAGIMSGQGEEDFDLCLRINFHGTENLLEAVRAHGQCGRFVFTSTGAVYGETDGPTVSDRTKNLPLNTYGMTKSMCELLINDYTRKGFVDGRSARLPTVIVRPGKPNAATTSCFSGVVREPLNGIDVALPLTGGLQHAITSTRAVVSGILALHEASTEAIQSLGSDRAVNMPSLSTNLQELIDATLRVAPRPELLGKVTYKPDARLCGIVSGMATATLSDRALALGLPAPPSLEQIIREYVADFGAPHGHKACLPDPDAAAESATRTATEEEAAAAEQEGVERWWDPREGVASGGSNADSELPVVGFIGLGNMGLGMAMNLARAGFPLVLHNRTAVKTEAAAAACRGARGKPGTGVEASTSTAAAFAAVAEAAAANQPAPALAASAGAGAPPPPPQGAMLAAPAPAARRGSKMRMRLTSLFSPGKGAAGSPGRTKHRRRSSKGGSGEVSGRAVVAALAAAAADPESPTAEALQGQGQVWTAQKPSDVATAADIILVCLASEDAAEQVFFAEGTGIFSSFGAGTASNKIVVDHSTVSTGLSLRCHKAAANAAAAVAAATNTGTTGVGAASGDADGAGRVAFLDAPISGGPEGAANGTLAIMAGGGRRAFARATPIFEAMGECVARMGGAGAGTGMKLVNQLLVGVHAVASAEALVLGKRLGLEDMRQAVCVLEKSWGNSKILQRCGNLISEYECSATTVDVDTGEEEEEEGEAGGDADLVVVTGEKDDSLLTTSGAPLRNMIKDLSFINAAAEGASLKLPVMQQTLRLFDGAVSAGHSESDMAVFYKLLQEQGELRRERL